MITQFAPFTFIILDSMSFLAVRRVLGLSLVIRLHPCSGPEVNWQSLATLSLLSCCSVQHSVAASKLVVGPWFLLDTELCPAIMGVLTSLCQNCTIDHSSNF